MRERPIKTHFPGKPVHIIAVWSSHKSDADSSYFFSPTHKRDNRTNNNVGNLHSLLAFFQPSSAGDDFASLNAKLSTRTMQNNQYALEPLYSQNRNQALSANRLSPIFNWTKPAILLWNSSDHNSRELRKTNRAVSWLQDSHAKVYFISIVLRISFLLEVWNYFLRTFSKECTLLVQKVCSQFNCFDFCFWMGCILRNNYSNPKFTSFFVVFQSFISFNINFELFKKVCIQFSYTNLIYIFTL